MPETDFDFDGHHMLSLKTLQEAGLISMEPGMVPKAYEEQQKELLKEAEEAMDKEKERPGLFAQVGAFWSMLQGKTPAQVVPGESMLR